MGAGPAGTTAALLLARKGFTVDVYEKRPDWRIHQEVEVEQDKCVTCVVAASAAAA